MIKKCPSCGSVLTHVALELMPIKGGLSASDFNGVAYVCPVATCRVILSVGIDPVALKTDTINGVVTALRGK